MFDVATENFSENEGSARGRWVVVVIVAALALCLIRTPALAKKRRGGELAYLGINLGAATAVDSLTLEDVGYNLGGSFKYISDRAFGLGVTFNASHYAYDARDGSEVEGRLSTTTLDIIFPLNFIHEKFDVYYSRGSIYWAVLAGVASESVKLNGKSFSLGVDDSGYTAGVALGMLYCYDLDQHKRQEKFGGLTLGSELRLLKFLEMDTTSAEVQLNFTVGYSF